jgi:hypothetical protein
MNSLTSFCQILRPDIILSIIIPVYDVIIIQDADLESEHRVFTKKSMEGIMTEGNRSSF